MMRQPIGHRQKQFGEGETQFAVTAHNQLINHIFSCIVIVGIVVWIII